jgi:hypothetical protein
MSANIVATDAQRSAVERELTPTEFASGAILALTIGSYARLLSERRIALEAFQEVVYLTIGIASRINGYPAGTAE